MQEKKQFLSKVVNLGNSPSQDVAMVMGFGSFKEGLDKVIKKAIGAY